MNSQTQSILQYMTQGHSITPIDALNRFGCFRLGARMYDIKKLGYEVETIMISHNGKKYACYQLKPEVKQLNLV